MKLDDSISTDILHETTQDTRIESEAKHDDLKKNRHPNRDFTLLNVFLGYSIAQHDKIKQAGLSTSKALKSLLNAQETAKESSAELIKNIACLEKINEDIQIAIDASKLTPWQVWLYQWSLVLYFILVDFGMAIIVEFYCRWHGASFISFDLYSPVNVAILSKIDFVNGPTTLSIAAEVLTWSSLGVWAQQNYANTVELINRKFKFAENTLQFVGTLMRNTSVAAIIVIILRISKFSVFGVSVDNTNPLLFDIVIGLSFLLGFFGDDAYRILKEFRNQVMKGVSDE